MSNVPKLGSLRVTPTNSTSLSTFDMGISTVAAKMTHVYSLDSRVKNLAETLENFQSNCAKKLSIPQVTDVYPFVGAFKIIAI